MKSLADKIELFLYGPFSLLLESGEELHVRSKRAQALLALLITAPHHKRTRVWLVDMLWGSREPEQGRASLRQATLELRRSLGPEAKDILISQKDTLALDAERIRIAGDPSDGELLEGLDIGEVNFEDWLRNERLRQPEATVDLCVPASPMMAPKPAMTPQQRLRPRIVILPFAMPTLPEVNTLGDMIAEEISRCLSRTEHFDVISHLSSRSFARKRVLELEGIRASLDCDFACHGIVRVMGERFELNADLIDLKTHSIALTRQFTCKTRDLLDGRAGFIADFAATIGRSVVETESQLAEIEPLPALESHTMLIGGINLMHRNDLKSFSRSRQLLEVLTEKHTKSALLHAWLAKWYVLSVVQGWSTSFSGDVERAIRNSRRALENNPDCAFSMAMHGFVKAYLMKEFDSGFNFFKRTTECDPNSAIGWLLRGVVHAFTDEGEKAVELTEKGSALSPLDPHRYFFQNLTATAYLAAGDFQHALDLADASLIANRRHISTHRVRTIALYALDRGDEAREAAREVLRRDPGLTVESYLHKHPAADFETGRFWASALKECGIP